VLQNRSIAMCPSTVRPALLVPTTGLMSQRPSLTAQVKNADNVARAPSAVVGNVTFRDGAEPRGDVGPGDIGQVQRVQWLPEFLEIAGGVPIAARAQAGPLGSTGTSAFASCGHSDAKALGRFVPQADICSAAKEAFAVGTRVTSRPPPRSVRAAFPHTAPTLGV
jgi:hypothetical protein